MIDLVLTKEFVDQLNEVLTSIQTDAEVKLILLVNKSGRLMASVGSDKIDATSVAALVSASFASTKAIANMMGETEFNTMFQQGQREHLFISLADQNTILATIFDDKTTIDIVKFFLRQYSVMLKKVLHQVYSFVESNPYINLDIGNEPETSASVTTPSDHEELLPTPGKGPSTTQENTPATQTPVSNPVDEDMYFSSIKKKNKPNNKQFFSKLFKSE